MVDFKRFWNELSEVLPDNMLKEYEELSQVLQTFPPMSYATLPTAKGYLADHNASGLRVGDKVKITGYFPSMANGWDAEWVCEKNNAIGKTGKIIRDNEAEGYSVKITEIEWSYTYPVYVLQKVNS